MDTNYYKRTGEDINMSRAQLRKVIIFLFVLFFISAGFSFLPVSFASVSQSSEARVDDSLFDQRISLLMRIENLCAIKPVSESLLALL